MVFTRKDGIFMGYVSFRQGNMELQNGEKLCKDPLVCPIGSRISLFDDLKNGILETLRERCIEILLGFLKLILLGIYFDMAFSFGFDMTHFEGPVIFSKGENTSKMSGDR